MSKVTEEKLYTIDRVDDSTDWGDGLPVKGADHEPPDRNINGTVRWTEHHPMRDSDVGDFEAEVREVVKEHYATVLRRFPELNVIILDTGEDWVDISLETTPEDYKPEGLPARVRNTTYERDTVSRHVEQDSVVFWLKGIETKRCKYCEFSDEMTDYTRPEFVKWLNRHKNADPERMDEYLRCNKHGVPVLPDDNADTVDQGKPWCIQWVLAVHRMPLYLFEVKEIFTGSRVHHVKAISEQEATFLRSEENMVDEGKCSPFFEVKKLE